MKTENKIILIILLIIGIGLVSVISATAQSTHLKWYRSLQSSMEYPARIKNNSAFTLKNAKESRKQAKKDNRIEASKERDRQKLVAIREQTAKIKDQ